MDFKKCEALLAAIDTGSFTKAAELLHYTPSGISHMMTNLEAELGYPLLYRSKTGVVPTPNALELLPILREMADCANRFEQISSRINGLQTGRLTIGVYTSIATCWLPPVIKAFAASYPGIRIILKEGVHQELDSLLENRQVDFCLYSEKSDNACTWIPLRKDPMIAVLPPEHPMAKEKVYPLSTCQQEDFIMPAYGADHDVMQLFRAHDIHPKVKYETIENHAALSMIAQGLGMSIMNRLITEGHTAKVVKLPLDPPYTISMGIALPSPAELSPAAQAFVDLTCQMLTEG